MSASAFSLSAAFPADQFEVTQGEPVIGGLHGEHRHYHCAHCKSWLFTRPNGFESFVNVRATMLDNCADYAPFMETCTSEKLAWATTPAKHSFAQFPPMEKFEDLVAEFAELELR
ncbi:MAG: GFA family protein [Parvularculaceae bacterium]|nr:GFA family protein [Parvularculaceae bacterium]